jgi:hypothetical protein
MVNFLRTAVVVIIFLQVNLVFAQETRIIRIQSGGTVNFNINSFKKYEEGMEYNDWTHLAIAFIDLVAPEPPLPPLPLVPSEATWSLGFTASRPAIEGDYMASSDLDLDLITLKVESVGGTPLTTYIQAGGSYSLSNIEQLIIIGAPQGDFDQNKLRISYSIGTGTKKLLNNPANYYYVDIEFILSRVD